MCRSFVKGCDWFDFVWCIKQDVSSNYRLLEAAIQQAGPWKGMGQSVDHQWLQAALKKRVETIDWTDAAEDVRRFLDTVQQQGLRVWSARFFSSKVDRLIDVSHGAGDSPGK